MDRKAIKDSLYGSIVEMMHNDRYYYQSYVDPCYSSWSEEGKQSILDVVTMISVTIEKEEKRLLDVRAKELVVKTLKGE